MYCLKTYMRVYRIAFVCIPLGTVWCTRDIFHWNRNCVISIESIEWLDSFTSKTVFLLWKLHLFLLVAVARNQLQWIFLTRSNIWFFVTYCTHHIFKMFYFLCLKRDVTENCQGVQLDIFTFASKLMPQRLFFKSGLDHPFL